MPTQMPRNGLALRDHAPPRSASTMPGTASRPAPAIGIGADAGQHDAVGGARRRSASAVRIDLGVDAGFAGGAFEGLGGRAQIARAVVDDGDAHGQTAPDQANRPSAGPAGTRRPACSVAGAAGSGRPATICLGHPPRRSNDRPRRALPASTTPMIAPALRRSFSDAQTKANRPTSTRPQRLPAPCQPKARRCASIRQPMAANTARLPRATGGATTARAAAPETPTSEKPSRTKARLRSLRSRLGGPCTTIARHRRNPSISVPLVDGIASGWRGSISMAVRSTRATALKQVSAMWWLLAP